MTHCDQQAAGVNNENEQIELGPVSQSKLALVWLRLSCQAPLRLMLATFNYRNDEADY